MSFNDSHCHVAHKCLSAMSYAFPRHLNVAVCPHRRAVSDVDAGAARNDRPVRRHEPPERDVGTHPGRGPGHGMWGAGRRKLDVLQRERDQGSEDGGARNYKDQVRPVSRVCGRDVRACVSLHAMC